MLVFWSLFVAVANAACGCNLEGRGIMVLTNKDIEKECLKFSNCDSLADIKDLYLWNNNIIEITAGVFQGLTNLEKLFLNHNFISEVHEGAFAGLDNLEMLVLVKNHLTSLPQNIFDDLPKLNELDMDDSLFCTNPGDPIFEEYIEPDSSSSDSYSTDSPDCRLKNFGQYICTPTPIQGRSFAANLPKCTVVDPTDSVLVNNGGMEVMGEGVVPMSSIPCLYGRISVMKCADCLYKISLYGPGSMLGPQWANLSPWPTQLIPGGRYYRWLPKYSCANFGCNDLNWMDGFNSKGEVKVWFLNPDSSAPCYCDDACTRYKDCCYDYQWTCRVGRAIKFTGLYKFPELGDMDYDFKQLAGTAAD